MDRNLLDIDVKPRDSVMCVNSLCGKDAGICKSCKLPAPTLLNGHCTACLKPCDISDHSCGVPSEEPGGEK